MKPKTKNSPRIAIVHDWLVGGGAEQVVLELHRMYPEAPIYTSYATDEWRDRLDNKVVTGWLGHHAAGRLRKLLAVPRAIWFRRLDLNGFDIVISSSGNGEANLIRPPKRTAHINYCHSPNHFLWRKASEYNRRPGLGIMSWPARLGLLIFRPWLQMWDKQAMQSPNVIVANSSAIAREIAKTYGRDSVVVHPPVDISRFKLRNASREGLISVSRLVPYKRIDLAIRACIKTKTPLHIIGQGPELATLKAIVNNNDAEGFITFNTNASDEVVANSLASAKGFIFVADEDFGIAPVEALASGTPLIAYNSGGANDYATPKTAVTFPRQSEASIVKALKRFNQSTFSPQDCREQAEAFDAKHFRKRMQTIIDKVNT